MFTFVHISQKYYFVQGFYRSPYILKLHKFYLNRLSLHYFKSCAHFYADKSLFFISKIHKIIYFWKLLFSNNIHFLHHFWPIQHVSSTVYYYFSFFLFLTHMRVHLWPWRLRPMFPGTGDSNLAALEKPWAAAKSKGKCLNVDHLFFFLNYLKFPEMVFTYHSLNRKNS